MRLNPSIRSPAVIYIAAKQPMIPNYPIIVQHNRDNRILGGSDTL